MKYITLIYSSFLILFCLGTTFLTLSSDHEIDPVFLTINMISIGIFMSTAYLLFKLYFLNQKTKHLPIHLYIVISIFSYYFIDIFRNDGSNFMYQSLFGLLGGIFFLMVINYRLKHRKHSRA